MNMSYCRFHNTRLALNECLNALHDLNNGESTISDDETKAGKRMFYQFLEYCADVGIIESFDLDAINATFDPDMDIDDGEED